MREMGFRLVLTIFLICFCMANVSGGAVWEDRVLPLPQEMRISDSIEAGKGRIGYNILSSEDAPVYRTVRELMGELGAEGKGKAVNISLVLLGEGDSAVPGAIKERLRNLPNFSQAYAIFYEKGEGPLEITLAANTPAGLLYAARTFSQLVKAGEDGIEIPLARIVDWPDIAQRGEWAPTGYSSLGWYSLWKLNMYRMCGESHREDYVLRLRYGDYLEGERKKEFFDWAEEIGYTLIPYVGHLGARAGRGWSHISPPVHTDEHPTPAHRGFCWSDDGIYRVLEDNMRTMAEMASRSPEGYKDVEVWLTEGGYVSCHCEGCGGENGYIMETKGIIKVYGDIKDDYNDLRLRILLSQGTRDINDAIVDIADRHNVGVGYYDGRDTYRANRDEIIFGSLENFARGGGMADVMPTVVPCHHGLYPSDMPQFIRFRSQEFVDKALQAVTAYSLGGSFYHRLNMAALAEYTWNANGRCVRDFARAYAVISGMENPELFSRWVVKEGEAAWELATTMYMRVTGRGNNTWLPEITGMDQPQRQQTLRLERVLPMAREALVLAREAGEPFMLVQSETTLAVLESIRLRSKLRDLYGSGAEAELISGKLELLDLYAQLVRINVYRWHKIARDNQDDIANSSGYIRPPEIYRTLGRFPSGRRQVQAYGALRVSDAERRTGELMGIEDTRGDMAAAEVAAWNEEDFDRGNAVISVDASDLIRPEGGLYILSMNHASGNLYRIGSVRVSVIDGRTGAKSREDDVDTAPGGNLRSTNYLIEIPERDTGERLHIEKLLTDGGNGSSGFITIRRVLTRDEFPEEALDRVIRGN